MNRGRPAYSLEKIDDFKQEVCRVALRLISEEGRQALSFRTLARAIGSSHTRVHRYFENKEAIIRGVREYAFGQFADALESATKEVKNPRDRVRSAGAAYFQFAHNDPDAFQVLFSDLNPTKRIETHNEHRAWEAIRSPIGEAVVAGELIGDPDVLSHVYWAAIHGVTTLSLSGSTKEGVEITDILAATFAGLRKGHGGNDEFSDSENQEGCS